MDLEGVSAIRDALEAYKGTVVYVTHHRDLIEGVATKVVLVENGKCEVFTGGFEEYLKLRGRR
jgi:ATP-binding cassette subfamily F protein 3